jgi:ribonuclease D
MIITTTRELNTICKRIKKSTNIIAIDTEFRRNNTYFPKLCCIQISFFDKKNDGENINCIIDILTKINLKSFIQILRSKKIKKVFHSFEQDLEAIYTTTKKFPKNIEDTQIMAALSSFGSNISYSNIVEKLCNTRLTKNETRSNWEKRPLSDEQINYAINDVKYLLKVYEELHKILLKTKRKKWYEEIKNRLIKQKKSKDNLPSLYKRFNTNHKSDEYLKILKTLILEREKVAKKNDRPREWLLSNNEIIQIARNKINNFGHTTKLLHSRKKHSFFDEIYILKLIKSSIKKTKIYLRDIKKTQLPALNSQQKTTYELIITLLKIVSDNNEICQSMIPNKQEIYKIIIKGKKSKQILSNWHYELYGKELDKFLNGKISIGINNMKSEISD